VLELSQLDWPRILYKRTTAILLGPAAVFSIPTLFFIHADIDPSKLSPVKGEVVSIVGAVGAFDFMALLMCMGFFWLRCDESGKLNKTVWFVILAIGCFYGAPVAYYGIVYLPAVLRRHRSPQAFQLEDELQEPETELGRIGPFSRNLMIGWLFVALAMIAYVAMPGSTPGLSAIAAVVFFICCAAIVFESLFHFVATLYRTGMRRSVRRNKN
jgi:hypothetical protein